MFQQTREGVVAQLDRMAVWADEATASALALDVSAEYDRADTVQRSYLQRIRVAVTEYPELLTMGTFDAHKHVLVNSRPLPQKRTTLAPRLPMQRIVRCSCWRCTGRG